MTKCSTFAEGAGASFSITLTGEAGGQKRNVVRALETDACTFALNALGLADFFVGSEILGSC